MQARRLLALASASVLLLLLPGCATQNTSTDARLDRVRQDMRLAITHARDRVYPALVNIHVVTISYWGGKETKYTGVGSGTIISPDGYILTNHHVAGEGHKFRLTLADKREVGGILVGTDPWTDLAVMKIDDADLMGRGPLEYAEFGDSDELHVGDYVLAMGSPFALSRSVTLGVVSNTERVFTSGPDHEVEQMEVDWEQRTGLFTRWIQHDALINPGNSGGPLVNLDGRIVGVNTRGGAGMGFATPSNLAQAVAQQIIAEGEVRRSSMGVIFRHLQRTDHGQGALVSSVESGGAGDLAGLRAGDVVTAINGEPINVYFPEEIPPLLRRIAELPVGSNVIVEYLRDGNPATTTVATTRLLNERGEQTALRLWGVSIREITERAAQERRLTDRQGVLVSGVRGGGPASVAEPSLAWDDIIRSINNAPITGYSDLIEQYEKLSGVDPLPEHILIGFERAGKHQLTLIKPRPPRRDDPPRELPKAWIGVATQPVLRELAGILGHPDSLGFRITRVYPGTLAAGADLRVGDLILAIDGETLSPRGMQDSGLFQRRVRNLSIGGEAILTVLRDGQRVDVTVPLERTRIGPEEARRDQNRDFEMTVRELTFFDRDDRRWDQSASGVLVESVERAGWAGLAGVFAGDLIQRIGAHNVTDLESYRAAMQAISAEQPARIPFLVMRWSRTYIKYAEPDWKPATDSDAHDAS